MSEQIQNFAKSMTCKPVKSGRYRARTCDPQRVMLFSADIGRTHSRLLNHDSFISDNDLRLSIATYASASDTHRYGLTAPIVARVGSAFFPHLAGEGEGR